MGDDEKKRHPSGEHPRAPTGEHAIVPERERPVDRLPRPAGHPRISDTLASTDKDFPHVRVVERVVHGVAILSAEVWRLVDRSGPHRNIAELAGPTFSDGPPQQRRRQVPMHDIVFVALPTS